jgi:hypothetical protein
MDTPGMVGAIAVWLAMLIVWLAEKDKTGNKKGD